MAQNFSPDKEIAMWQFKKLLKRLQTAQGNGTSLISIIIPAGGQISLVSKKLVEEYGAASNIKSPVNR